MSSSSSALNEELKCSICLDVFTNPVSTPCGHNFCQTCLNECWKNTQKCSCPICKETFSKRPDLKINTTLREVVQHFEKKFNLGDHKTHNTVPIEDETAKKNQLVKTQTDVQQMIQNRMKKIQDIQRSVEMRKRNTEEEKSHSVEEFTDLIRSIERCQTEVVEMLEEKQKAAEKQAEDLIKELEQEITELKRRNCELEQISHTEDHLHLLQIDPSLYSPKNSKNWTEISIDTHVDTLNTALTRLKDTLDQRLGQAVLRRMQQYAVDVTLDPDTAHPKLILSDDGKQVTCGDIRKKLPDKPERFDHCVNVLGKKGFSSGRFYFEVQVKGKTEWDLGVARESINRKGQITVTPVNGFWTVGLRNENEYKARAGPRVSLCVRMKPQKVGVFVDYEEGLVSFYDVESSSHIYSFTGQSFTQTLFPFFGPSLNYNGKNSTPLIITAVSYN
ncbi:zinc-binding protein A33-like [Xyrauchen texanus]|uniref:zinc-binding protein A33-like n=1 Tax=Xyrauchen texanus TaxID=154827 RepID=UPI002241F31D|nr:zinc-binding protein A33-like [Xyrauchen texanus]XP_051956143.1 zinc-binding protein A33-like [Xyrauchen texanus]